MAPRKKTNIETVRKCVRCTINVKVLLLKVLTCNSSVETIILSSVELQPIVDKLPQERKHAKERSESNCISAKERVLEDVSESSSSCGAICNWLFRSSVNHLLLNHGKPRPGFVPR